MNMSKIGFIFALGVFIIPMAAIAQAPDPELEQLLSELTELEQTRDELEQELAELEVQGQGEFTYEQPEVESKEVVAVVQSILVDEEVDGQRQMQFVAEADSQRYTINTADSYVEGLRYNIKEGDKIYVQVIEADGELIGAFLVDVVRTSRLMWLALFFAVVVIAVGLWRGAASLLGLLITFAVLFLVVFPSIIAGRDPVLMTVIGSIIILAVNMHLSHGFNKRTVYAYSSTIIGLILAYVFATVFVGFTNLSGLASEEAALLFFQGEYVNWPQGILLAGIILGAVGVLDDIAITQSEVVSELKEADEKLSRKELFTRAMKIGRHHIASTINTLVLAYAGVAMPLLLLFMITQGVTPLRFLNEEPVAEEIVRTLAGTMALILTVPISTWLATFAHKD